MAEAVLAAGVLGVAGWGIYKRSVAVAAIADVAPLPPELELISRQYVLAVLGAPESPAGVPIPLAISSELITFINATGWATDAPKLVPGAANIGDGTAWNYERLFQATSLNMMALVNVAHAAYVTPQIRPSKIGTGVSIFDLTATAPVGTAHNKNASTLDAQIAAGVERIETWLNKEIPIPQSLQPLPAS